MRTALAAGVGSLLVLGWPAHALAHHSFAAEFDINRPIQLAGTVAKVEWINPHAWIHVEVKKPDGTTEIWAIETGTPNTLLRRGLRKQDPPDGRIPPMTPEAIAIQQAHLRAHPATEAAAPVIEIRHWEDSDLMKLYQQERGK